jgi:hypothetical protein
MTRNSFIRGAFFGAMLGWLATFLWFWTPSALTIRSTYSPGGAYLAQVEMTRGFPYLVVNAHLTVRRVMDGELVLRQALTALDVYSDGLDQIHGIRWTDAHTVVVDMDSPNFKGHREFPVERDPVIPANR